MPLDYWIHPCWIFPKPQIQAAFFLRVLFFYPVIVFWKSLIIVAVRWDSWLHTSMYFFLIHFSFLDICYSTAGNHMSWPNASGTCPHLLYQLLCPDDHIPLSGDDRIFPPCCYGLWQIHCCLQSPPCVISALWTIRFAYRWPWEPAF